MAKGAMVAGVAVLAGGAALLFWPKKAKALPLPAPKRGGEIDRGLSPAETRNPTAADKTAAAQFHYLNGQVALSSAVNDPQQLRAIASGLKNYGWINSELRGMATEAANDINAKAAQIEQAQKEGAHG